MGRVAERARSMGRARGRVGSPEKECPWRLPGSGAYCDPELNESTMTGVCPLLPDDRIGPLLGVVTVFFFSQEERGEKPGRNYIR